MLTTLEVQELTLHDDYVIYNYAIPVEIQRAYPWYCYAPDNVLPQVPPHEQGVGI